MIAILGRPAVGFTSHQVMSPDCYRGLQGVCCVGLVLQKKPDISSWKLGYVSPYIFMSSLIKSTVLTSHFEPAVIFSIGA